MSAAAHDLDAEWAEKLAMNEDVDREHADYISGFAEFEHEKASLSGVSITHPLTMFAVRTNQRPSSALDLHLRAFAPTAWPPFTVAVRAGVPASARVRGGWKLDRLRRDDGRGRSGRPGRRGLGPGRAADERRIRLREADHRVPAERHVHVVAPQGSRQRSAVEGADPPTLEVDVEVRGLARRLADPHGRREVRREATSPLGINDI